jgi:hypothetical protein
LAIGFAETTSHRGSGEKPFEMGANPTALFVSDALRGLDQRLGERARVSPGPQTPDGGIARE